jgi:hypothetical protein
MNLGLLEYESGGCQAIGLSIARLPGFEEPSLIGSVTFVTPVNSFLGWEIRPSRWNTPNSSSAWASFGWAIIIGGLR